MPKDLSRGAVRAETDAEETMCFSRDLKKPDKFYVAQSQGPNNTHERKKKKKNWWSPKIL